MKVAASNWNSFSTNKTRYVAPVQRAPLPDLVILNLQCIFHLFGKTNWSIF